MLLRSLIVTEQLDLATNTILAVKGGSVWIIYYKPFSMVY